jgi:hypothetical protein
MRLVTNVRSFGNGSFAMYQHHLILIGDKYYAKAMDTTQAVCQTH